MIELLDLTYKIRDVFSSTHVDILFLVFII